MRTGSSNQTRRGAGSAAKLVLAAIAAAALCTALLLPYVGGIAWPAAMGAETLLNDSCNLRIEPAPQASTIYASDGSTPIATMFSQDRVDVPLAQIPVTVQQALISTEDRTYWTGGAVDVSSLIRALAADSEGADQGGSTLAMQYVKQVAYLQATTPAAQQAAIAPTLSRKIENAKCAIALEREYSKAQILDDYFNVSYFGENAYGIEAAAETYFDTPASQLNVDQGALLVGLLQAPTSDDPVHYPQAAVSRRNEVLQDMVATHDLSAAQAAADSGRPVQLSSAPAASTEQGCANANPAVSNAGFFCDYVVSYLNAHGVTQQLLDTGGLRVVTTLNVSLQNSGQTAVWKQGLPASSPTSLVMPAIAPQTGDVLAMITSKPYGTGPGQSTLPLFTAGYAGAGSTYKYFTALAALKLGVQPDYTLTSGSDTYTTKNCPTTYTVHNAGTFAATLPLSLALPESVNSYFVALEDQLFGCDISPIVNTALGLGMNQLNEPEAGDTGQTIAQAVTSEQQSGFTLGFSPTSALELSGAYSALANGGVFCPPTPVTDVTGPAGAAVAITQAGCSRQFDPQIADTLLSIMTTDTTSHVGTASSYFTQWYADGGSPIASKTGTDSDLATGPDHGNGNSALWFVGVTPNLVSAAALVNPTDPKATVVGLPAKVANTGSDVFGAYASTFWLAAFEPLLRTEHWQWPTTSTIAGARPVPDVTGLSESSAAEALARAGFLVQPAPITCGGGQPDGTVAYYEPHIAERGSAVTVCLSSGRSPGGPAPPNAST